MAHDPIRILTSPAEVEPHVGAIQRIADRNTKELGFLPKAAYATAAAAGRLWVAMPDSQEAQPAAYLFFGGHSNQVRVYQIFVDTAHRGQKLAARLLDRLVTAATRQRKSFITARVAEDLPANEFWRKAGFRCVDQKVGSSASGRSINVYIREIATTLFPALDLEEHRTNELEIPALSLRETPVYVIDVNFLLDILYKRSDAESARRLFQSAMSHEMHLYVTPEFMEELRRNSPTDGPDMALEIARGFPELPLPGSEELDATVAAIDDILHPHMKSTGPKAINDRSDVRHLAVCIHNQVTGFITRDRNILRHAPELFRRFNLEVLTAADFFPGPVIDPNIDVAPTILVSERLALGPIRTGDHQDIESFFRRISIPPSPLLAETITAPYTALVRIGKSVLGLAAWRYVHAARQFEGVILVDDSSPQAGTATDHLLESVIRSAQATSMVTIHLRTHASQLNTIRAAQARGFASTKPATNNVQGLMKLALNTIVLEPNWGTFQDEFRTAAARLKDANQQAFQTAIETCLSAQTLASFSKAPQLFDFESAFGPGILHSASRQAVIVPIRPHYAGSLLPGVDPQRRLYDPEATVRPVRAYFMNPDRLGYFEKGATIVFYVSRPVMAAVAIARVANCGHMTTKQAEVATLRQGALVPEEIGQYEKRGRVGMLTFDNALLFPTRVTYQTLKELGCVGGANLVSAERLRGNALTRLVTMAFTQGD